MVRVLCVGAALLLSLSAVARTSFTPIPADKPGEKPSGLTAQVVSYDGATNGEITVDVKNPTGAPIEFAAAGLYFVPSVDPDHSPQRLGAVGSYQVQTKDTWARHEKLSIPAGATVRTRMDVYCIDSHRPSPTSSTPFHLASDRIPVAITQAIHQEAAAASAPMGGMAAPAAKSIVQGTVWKNRDARWVKLDGEGKQEAGK